MLYDRNTAPGHVCSVDLRRRLQRVQATLLTARPTDNRMCASQYLPDRPNVRYITIRRLRHLTRDSSRSVLLGSGSPNPRADQTGIERPADTVFTGAGPFVFTLEEYSAVLERFRSLVTKT